MGQTSSAQTVTLTNGGGTKLTNLVTAVNGDFAIPAGGSGAGGANACGSTLPVGANCALSLTFTPSQARARAGTLTVTATDLSAPLTVALSGYGQDFTLQVSGSSSAIVTSGQTATFSLAITPLAGSTMTLALACTGRAEELDVYSESGVGSVDRKQLGDCDGDDCDRAGSGERCAQRRAGLA